MIHFGKEMESRGLSVSNPPSVGQTAALTLKTKTNTFGIRRLRDRMCLILFFFLRTISAATSGPSLDCINYYEKQMFCQFEVENCTEYNLTLLRKEKLIRCIFHECDTGCCCSVPVILVTGETHNATVWKGRQSIESKVINITASIKPKTPTNISVEETNGNYRVKWNTNKIAGFTKLIANVTYYKKGDTREVFYDVKNCYEVSCSHEIQGRKLKPSTTYAVSVKSFLDWSKKFSDSSEEKEFTTAASSHILHWGIIFSLSIAAVIITAVAFGCYIKVMAKWLETSSKCPRPKPLDMRPGKQNILQPLQTSFSSVCIDSAVPKNYQPWSEASLTDSGSPTSSLLCADIKPVDVKAGVQDALGKAFTNLPPFASMATSLPKESNKDSGLFSAPHDPFGNLNFGPGSTDFDNMTYSNRIPGCPQQHLTDIPETQTQAEMVCDSAYHPSEGNTVTCPDKPVPHIPTDMSHQQCRENSVRFSYAKDSSLSSISAASNTCDPVSSAEAGS